MECMYSVNRYIFLFFHTNTHKETVLSKHLITLLNLYHQLFFPSLDATVMPLTIERVGQLCSLPSHFPDAGTCVTTRSLRTSTDSADWNCFISFASFHVLPQWDLNRPLLQFTFLPLEVYQSFSMPNLQECFRSRFFRLLCLLMCL